VTELASLAPHHGTDVLVARLTGEIDASNAGVLEERIAGVAGPSNPLVVDLTAVTFLDSAGVRLLHHLAAGRQQDRQIRLVVPPSGAVPFTLRVCGFRTDLQVATVDDAVTAVAPSA